MKKQVDKCRFCAFARRLSRETVYCPFFSCAAELLGKQVRKDAKELQILRAHPPDGG